MSDYILWLVKIFLLCSTCIFFSFFFFSSRRRHTRYIGDWSSDVCSSDLSGFLELLEDEDLDEPTRHEFQETMSEQVRRLTKLAEELLDLSQLDAGRLHVETDDVDLAALAAGVVAEFAAVAKATDHPLEL